MSARIEELEAENTTLRSMVEGMINDTGDDPEIMAASRAEWAARALEAEAKLAKAVAPDTIWVDFNDEGAVVAGGAGPARYAGEHTYVKARGGHDE